MTAPRILPPSKSQGFLPALPTALFERYRPYVVVEEGVFSGRRWRPGEVILCAGEGDGSVVLEARGLGRPRLGCRLGLRLTGDAGEVCSQQRWMVAGRVVGVLREARIGEQVSASPFAPSGWVIERLQEPTPSDAPVGGNNRGQLPLFSLAA